MKIGILQTGHAPEQLQSRFGDYDAMFMRLLDAPDNAFVVRSVVDGDFPASPADAEAWVVTGSRCGVYDGDAWIARAGSFLREADTMGVPILGICFGHQLVAQAFGGTVQIFDGGWNCGLQSYDYEGFDRPVRLIAWHQDQVIEPPGGAEIIASSGRCRFAAMRIGPRILTIQPHPEFTVDYMREHAALRRDVIGSENVEAALDSFKDGPADDFSSYLLEFLRGARDAVA